MRLPIALVLCTFSANAIAEDIAARASGTAIVAEKMASPDATSAVFYNNAVAVSPHCDAVINDDALRELVQQQAREIGVDEKLALVILNLESRNGAEVNSPKGARGPMQLMPATAAQYGVKDICDPGQNVRGGLLFLKDLSAQFSGNLMLIAAAYNAGSERVHRAHGVPAIPETVRYVASAANQYYDLAPLSAQRGKAPPRRANKSDDQHVVTVSAEKPEARKPQEWIGGSVLYVSSQEQGDQ